MINTPKVQAYLIPFVFIVGMISISFSAIFVKWSTAPVSVIAMYRLLITCLIILPFIWTSLRQHIKLFSWSDWLGMILSGFTLALHFLLWMGSLHYTTVSSSTVLLTLEPIFVLVGGYWFYKERTTFRAIVGMFIAVIGTVMIGWGDLRLSDEAVFGDILSILGSLAVAFHMLLGKTYTRKFRPLVYSFVVFMSASLTLAIYNLTLSISMTGYSSTDWFMFLLLALIPTLLGHVLFNWLLAYMQTATVSMSVLGEPVGSTILAYVLLGESIFIHQAFAGMILLIGVWMFIRFNEKNKP